VHGPWQNDRADRARLGVLAGASPARAETEVDLALVLAVDISYSMDMDELTLQRQGFAEPSARRSYRMRSSAACWEDLGRLHRMGRLARPARHGAVVDHRRAADRERLRRPGRGRAGAARAAHLDLGRDRFFGEDAGRERRRGDPARDRRVGRRAEQPGPAGDAGRDEAVAQGITINGLPLQLKQPGYLDIPDLDVYYKDCVIGGQGAFMIPVRDKAQFQNAIKTKVLLEVAGLTPPSR
jgi:hypothetical protein